MTGRLVLGVLLGIVLLLPATPAMAHASWPVYVAMTESTDGTVLVRWQVPAVMPDFAVPAPVLPAVCAAEGPARREPDDRAFVFTRSYRCSAALEGRPLGIRYPQHNPSLTTLYHIELATGRVLDHVAGPGEGEWVLPARAGFWQTMRGYGGLGVRHILSGVDHLLFVLCVIVIAGSGRLVMTITGFTLGHSLTLALAALGIVTPPAAPIEAGIALSIAFLAAEILRNDRGTLAWRHPVALSALFGLLHGFGFAGALREAGLPEAQIPAALFSFNLGVEAGQLVFVLLAVPALLLLRRGWARLPFVAGRPAPVPLCIGYGAGSLAAFWYVERVTGFWTG